jgi:hypothetical protein
MGNRYADSIFGRDSSPEALQAGKIIRSRYCSGYFQRLWGLFLEKLVLLGQENTEYKLQVSVKH